MKNRFLNKDMVPTFGTEFSSEVDEKDDSGLVWTTDLIEDLRDKVENVGLDLDKVKHPFFEKNINLKRGRTAFEFTPEELEEFKKCKKDIIYFANKYVKIMQEDGISNFELYPYQEQILRMYQEERYSIVLGSRQVGKCSLSSTYVELLKVKVQVHRLYFKNKKDKNIIDYVKYGLYRLYDFLS